MEYKVMEKLCSFLYFISSSERVLIIEETMDYYLFCR